MQPKMGLSESGETIVNGGTSLLNNKAKINIGVSGKRFVPPEERQGVYEEIKKRIIEILEQHQASDFVGFTALATGADTIFAQVVIDEFHKPLHVILPFALEEYKKDFKEEGDLKIFLDLLERSSEMEVSSLSVPANPEDRSLDYFKSGRCIVEACHEMIFVWDEQKPSGVGGTGDVMGFFGEKNPYVQVNYIKVSPKEADSLDVDLVKGYEESNSAAIRARDLYRIVWMSAILIGLLGAGCFATVTAFRIEGTAAFVLTLIEFHAFAIVSLLIFFAGKLDYHGNYLEKRCDAETYRLLKVFYHIGVTVKISDRSNDEETKFSTLANRINDEVQQSKVASRWHSQLVIKELIRDQREYHNNKYKSIGKQDIVYGRISKFIGVAFLINVFVHMMQLLKGGESAPETLLYKLSVYLSIQLPAIYVAVEGFIYFNEWAMLKEHSRSCHRGHTKARSYLPRHIENKTNDECHDSHAMVLNFISDIMLTDNRNWKALLQSKDNYTRII